MSGGKGGSKTTEKALPDWLRGPAERNLQRAEAVQQIPYMPYYGPEVAAFTPAQNAAFDANIGAAEAFGLLAPNTLTATSGMPTPTEWAGGFTGYSSQPLYDQALAELNARQPGAVAQYNALFGNATPALVPRGGGGGSRFRGDAGGNPPPKTKLPSDYNAAKWGADRVLTETSKGGKGGRGNVGARLGSGKKAGSLNRKYVQNRAVQNVNRINKAAGSARRKDGRKIAVRTGGKYGFGL
jgi:hypothetical protein